MAKDNFLLKKSYEDVINELSDKEVAELTRGIFKYVNTGKNNLNGALKAIFIPIKKFIDDNEEKYQKICERNRENGSKGGRPKNEQPNETQENPLGYFGKNTHISFIHYSLNNKNNIKYITKEYIYNLYSNTINSNISTIEYEKLNEYIDIFTNDLRIIAYAIEICQMNKVFTIKYLCGILRNWNKKGYKTYEEIIEQEKIREESQNINVELFDYDWINESEDN